MSKNFIIAVLLICFAKLLHAQTPIHYLKNETIAYNELIEAYQRLADESPVAELFTYGTTDTGKPLHLFVVSGDGNFSAEKIRNSDKSILLINNGIHAGEPCGIEASLRFANDIVKNQFKLQRFLKNAVVCIIPAYNIGGMINRSPHHRTNQTDPIEAGFRANARNLDLNRDFAKCKTANARTFAQIFHEWQPHVFLDTHTTNGSDHQHKVTYIYTEFSYENDVLSNFVNNKMLPQVKKRMQKAGYDLIPYVNYMFHDPRQGIADYVETARYSTGYASLFGTISIMTENHIYKPFKDRVLSANEFIISLFEYCSKNAKEIRKVRSEIKRKILSDNEFTLRWTMDSTRWDSVKFKGYETYDFTSDITGLPSLGYDREKPYKQTIKYYRFFNSELKVKKPWAYVVPQAWHEVIERLKLNNVDMQRIANDTVMNLSVFYIKDYKSRKRLYEGQFPHLDVQIRDTVDAIQLFAGDYIIRLNQLANRYLVEMLDPRGADSFFAWNFFDTFLQQKEFVSPYIFDQRAKKVVEEHPEILDELELAKKEDPELAHNHYYQLWFIYVRSPFYEKNHLRYPIFRIETQAKLNIAK